MYTKVVRDDFDENIIDITFMVTNKCNYNCQYCIENLQSLDKNDALFLDLNRSLQFIDKYCNTYDNKINIRIYGGEPTLHQDLFDFCSKLNCYDKIIIIEIFTNFSLSYEYYKKLLTIPKLHLYTSYHTNTIMPDNQYLSKILKLNNYAEKITCNIMLENSSNINFENSYNLYKKLMKIWKTNTFKKTMTNLIPLFSTKKYQSIYNSQKFKLFDILNNHNNNKICFTLYNEMNSEKIYNVVGYDSYNFKGWKCTSGKNALFIDMLGNVYPCGGLYTKRQLIYKDAKMKNIFSSNFNDIFQYTLCPHNDCVLCVPMKVENINNNCSNIYTDIYKKINVFDKNEYTK